MRFIPTIQDRKLQELLCRFPPTPPALLPQCHFPSSSIGCLLLPGACSNEFGGRGKPMSSANLVREAWRGGKGKEFAPCM